MLPRTLAKTTIALILFASLQAPATAASVESAIEAFKQGYYEVAARELDVVLAADPALLSAIYWLARCEMATGDAISAESHLRHILANKPRSTESRYWLGQALAAQGRYQEAIATFEAVLKQDSQHSEARQAIVRVQQLPPNMTQLDSGGLSGLAASALGLDASAAELLSSNVYDYAFSKAPTDWIIRSGLWNATNRWTCQPQWSWYGGYAPDGIAAMWNKRDFSGDIVVEMYFAFKMRVGRAPTYLPPNDMNISICGDGANPDSGYSFIIGGNDNRITRITKGTEILAETSDLEALWPILENGQPSTYEWHRKWWGIRVRKIGGTLQLYLDNKLVLEAKDDDPLPGGRVGIWCLRNDIITPRIKVYYEDEKRVRTPLPEDKIHLQPPAQVSVPNFRISSQSHYSIQEDFENELGTLTTRDKDQGAELRIVTRGDNAGHCLQLLNTAAGGSFGVNIRKQQFDVARLPILSFDYRITPDSKVNLYLTCAEETYEIVFTGHEQPASGCTLLGTIPDVKPDGQWHHAQFDLLAHLQALMPAKKTFNCTNLWAGNASNRGYLLAGFDGNRINSTWYMDRFALGQPHGKDLKLYILPKSNIIKGYAVSVDNNPLGAPPAKVTTEERSINLDLPADGTWYAHIKPLLENDQWGPVVHYRAQVDTQPPVVKSADPKPDATIADVPISITFADPGGSGIDLAKLAVRVNDRKLTAADYGLRWDPAANALIINPAVAGVPLQNGESATIELVEWSDRAGNTAKPKRWAYLVNYNADKTPPAAPTIAISDAYIVDDTFEENMGGWESYGGKGAARIWRDETTSASGHYSLKIYNPAQGGRFGAHVTRQRFEAGKHRIVSFDYKCDDRLRADFAVYVNGDIKGIKFTDNDNSLGIIGTVPEVITDNKWHHAEIDLYEMLKRDDPTAAHYEVRQFYLADWGYTGNRVGACYNIDNFRIIPVISGAEPVSVEWASADGSGLAGVSFLADEDASKVPERRLMEKGNTFEVALRDIWRLYISARAQDRAGNWGEVVQRAVLVDSKKPTAAATAPRANAVTATSTVLIKLLDTGQADIDPNSIALEVGDKNYTIANEGLQYHRKNGQLVWNCEDVSPTPVVFDDKANIPVKLIKAADYAGNEVDALPSWSWTMSYAADKTGPTIREVKSPTHPVLIANTFEDGVAQWRNRGGARGADLTIDETTAASGKASLKLTNRSKGGAMSASIYAGNFSADQYETISFDYKIKPSVKLDFALIMDGRWWELGFTGAAGATSIGKFAGINQDDKWHHATFNLRAALRAKKARGSLTISQIIIGERNTAANAAGAVAHIDNFIIGKVATKSPVIRWEATDTTGMKAYSYSIDRDPLTVPDTESEGLAVAKQFGKLNPPGLWHFHLRAQDGAGNWSSTTTHTIMYGKP